MADPSPHAASSRDAEAHRLRALDRLRDRVEKAAEEIERLRTENAALTARVQELGALDTVEADPDAIGLTFDEEPEELRAKIEGFIGAIDRLLAEPADEASEASS